MHSASRSLACARGWVASRNITFARLVCVVSFPASSMVVHSARISSKGIGTGRFSVGVVGMEEKRSGFGVRLARRVVTRCRTMALKFLTWWAPLVWERSFLKRASKVAGSWAKGILVRIEGVSRWCCKKSLQEDAQEACCTVVARHSMHAVGRAVRMERGHEVRTAVEAAWFFIVSHCQCNDP